MKDHVIKALVTDIEEILEHSRQRSAEEIKVEINQYLQTAVTKQDIHDFCVIGTNNKIDVAIKPKLDASFVYCPFTIAQ